MIFGRHINKYYVKYLWLFVIGILSLLAVDYLQLKIPEFLGIITDGLARDPDTGIIAMGKEDLAQKILEILGIVGLIFIMRFLWRVTLSANGPRIEADLRSKMFSYSMTLSQDYYSKHKTGDIMAIYTNDLDIIKQSISQGTLMFFDTIFLGVLTAVKMFMLDFKMALFVVIPLFVLGGLGILIGRIMQKRAAARQAAFADLSDFTVENITGLSVIKAFVKEQNEIIHFAKKNKDNYEKNMSFAKAAALIRVVINLFINFILMGVFAYGAYLVFDQKTLTTGQLITFVSLLGHLIWPIMGMSMFINMHAQAKASLQRVNGLLDYKPDIVDREDVVDVETLSGEIEVTNLSFKYPGLEENVIEDISFKINAGESIGILGKTGSGKTTLIDTLMRIYNVEDGMIKYDGIDINKIPLKVLRDNTAIVPQDNFLFYDTVYENIAFGTKRDVTNHEVMEVAKLADLDSNIEEFQNGYETMIGERGSTISGGQKQRVSIARALIKDAPVLILDDSVSAVDTDTEDKIIRNLKATRKGKTTILIAHRVSTVRKLDRILLIDEGKVIGFGTHDELLENPLYSNLVRLQSLEEEIEGGAK
ncbi:MAG TPA: ABC transporter ATP-binding protein [Acholeplasma sp.]|nr:ABC transporter ATP-binding protein [Acholeplasma sp.]